jgi:hypothetical protein
MTLKTNTGKVKNLTLNKCAQKRLNPEGSTNQISYIDLGSAVPK